MFRRSGAYTLVFMTFTLFWGCKNDNSSLNAISKAIVDYIEYDENNKALLAADISRWDRDFNTAIDRYQEILSASVDDESIKHYHYILNQLTYCYLSINKYKKAKLILQKIDSNELSDNDRAYFLLYQGKFLKSQGRGIEAITAIERADSLFQRFYGETHLKRLECLTELGELHFFYSNQPNHLEIIFHYLDKAQQQIRNDKALVNYSKDFLSWQAFVSFIQRKHSEGIISANNAISLAKEQPYIDSLFIAKCMSRMGMSYKAQDSLEYAKSLLSNAYNFIPQSKDRVFDKQEIAFNLITYYITSRKDSIFHAHVNSETQKQDSTISKEYLRLNSIFYSINGDYEQSKLFTLRVLKSLNNGQITYNRARMYAEAYFLLSNCYKQLNQLDSAIYYNTQYLLRGTDISINPPFNWNDVISKKVQDKNVHAFIDYGNLADTYAFLGENGRDFSNLKKSLELFLIADTMLFNYHMMANEEAALNFLSEVAAAYYPKAVSTCYQLFQYTQDEKYISYATFFMERTKAFSLYRDTYFSKGKVKCNSSRSNDLIRKENRLKQKIKTLYWERQQNHISDEYEEINFELQEKIQELASLSTEISNNCPSFYSSKMQHSLMIYDQAKEYAKNSSQNIIQYTIANGQVYSILTNKDTSLFKTTMIPTSIKRLKSLTTGYYNYLSNSSKKDSIEAYKTYLTTANQLYGLLLDSLESHIGINSKVLIVPDVNLANLPFDALLYEQVKKQDTILFHQLPYLVNNWQISYAASLKTHILNQYERKFLNKTPRILAFAYSSDKSYQLSQNKSNRSELPGSYKDIQSIKKNFPKIDSRNKFFKGISCSKKNFLRHSKKKYDILHLSTHAEIDMKSVFNNRLYFRKFDARTNEIDDEKLNSIEITDLNLNIPLIILSACQTNIGLTHSAEGTYSLSRSFIEAGAKEVISTLWKVKDERTHEVFRDFYNNLKNHESPSSSIVKAKRTYIKGHTSAQNLSFPGFWAGIVHIQ